MDAAKGVIGCSRGDYFRALADPRTPFFLQADGIYRSAWTTRTFLVSTHQAPIGDE